MDTFEIATRLDQECRDQISAPNVCRKCSTESGRTWCVNTVKNYMDNHELTFDEAVAHLEITLNEVSA